MKRLQKNIQSLGNVTLYFTETSSGKTNTAGKSCSAKSNASLQSCGGKSNTAKKCGEKSNLNDACCNAQVHCSKHPAKIAEYEL